ncbi:hypothetical protein ACX80Z_11505 [Arthrobacter sp. TMT4-20]
MSAAMIEVAACVGRPIVIPHHRFRSTLSLQVKQWSDAPSESLGVSTMYMSTAVMLPEDFAVTGFILQSAGE